jgi:hypothetical protein
MQTPEERIRTYRLRAEEVRTATADMHYPDSRATFLRIARDYDVIDETAAHARARRDKAPKA